MGCETESQARESYLYMKYRQAAKRKVNLDGLRNGEYRARKYEVPPKRLDQRKARTEDVTETAPLGSASRNISGKHLKEITTLPGEHGFGRGNLDRAAVGQRVSVRDRSLRTRILGILRKAWEKGHGPMFSYKKHRNQRLLKTIDVNTEQMVEVKFGGMSDGNNHCLGLEEPAVLKDQTLRNAKSTLMGCETANIELANMKSRRRDFPAFLIDQRKARTEDVTETAPLGSASRNISGKHLEEITTLPGEHGFGRGERGFGRGPGRRYGLPTCSRGSNSFNGGLNVPDVDHNFGL
ncbi:hypothetical protein C8R43DRAFT_964264 [Mycena crocata]|nr:hypothetical protein C8R43DRAFT_964264 [Mycena crocata]